MSSESSGPGARPRPGQVRAPSQHSAAITLLTNFVHILWHHILLKAFQNFYLFTFSMELKENPYFLSREKVLRSSQTIDCNIIKNILIKLISLEDCNRMNLPTDMTLKSYLMGVQLYEQCIGCLFVCFVWAVAD